MTKYIGFIGSRHRYGETLEKRILDMLRHFFREYNSDDIVIVSGGAKGVDTTAIRLAKRIGLQTREYLPKNDEYSSRYDKDGNLLFQGKYNKIYYERNLKIAERCDILVAYPLNSSRGTMMTIDLFKKKRGFKISNLYIYNSSTPTGG